MSGVSALGRLHGQDGNRRGVYPILWLQWLPCRDVPLWREPRLQARGVSKVQEKSGWKAELAGGGLPSVSTCRVEGTLPKLQDACESPADPAEMQILIPQIWRRAQSSAFLTSSLVIPRLLAYSPHFQWQGSRGHSWPGCGGSLCTRTYVFIALPCLFSWSHIQLLREGPPFLCSYVLREHS